MKRGGKAVKTASTGRKRGRKPTYQGAAFTALLQDIWSLFDCLCGKLLAPMLRLMLDFLTTEYSLTPEMRNLLASVSPRTIDRILKPVKDQGRLRGLSLTRPGPLLRDQIPVRVMFNWDQRKPGFFEFHRVAHCGPDASGQFCQTLTGTDVGSGWTEEHASFGVFPSGYSSSTLSPEGVKTKNPCLKAYCFTPALTTIP
ncbi:MAG: transposase, partial [Treponema sp.]|nr:transposase [Treponema sp.]